MDHPKKNCALILPGAVAKGAYEAGVIDVLSTRGIKVNRVVATSSGALNGIAYAAGIRSGDVEGMSRRLLNAWVEGGGWAQALHLDPFALLTGRGLSNSDGLLHMLRALVKPCTAAVRHHVEFRVIVAPLEGVSARIGGKDATTFEKMVAFCPEDFDSEVGLERMFTAVTAACAFPGLFKPVEVEGLGPCIDGGAVNNAPIKYALDENDVDRIFVVVPYPEAMAHLKSCRHAGFALTMHLVEILINERLFRDLRDSQVVNTSIARIHRLVDTGVLTPVQAHEVKKALQIRRVDITEIRPDKAVPGNAFSGFFSRADRERLIEEGRRAAQQCLDHVEPESDAKEKSPVE